MRALAVLAVLTSTALLAGCSAQAASVIEPAAGTVPTAAVSVVPRASPSPSPAPVSVDPLTGRSPAPGGAVVGIKIDNSPLARPFHRGLGHAAILYQEMVEGGSSRFFAVFTAATDTEVGPIRSLREPDVELAQQFGRIALAASGANTGVLGTVARADRDGLLFAAHLDAVPAAYRRGERRADAINYFTSPQKIDQARPGGSPVQDVGLRFGPVPGGATPAARTSVRMSQITKIDMAYDSASGTYAVFQDGDRMNGFAPTNVIVQSVRIRDSRYVDVLGNPTPYTETVGTGAATLLRDGVLATGTWSRPEAQSGTRFLDAAGSDLGLRPGPTLVLMVPAGRSVAVG